MPLPSSCSAWTGEMPQRAVRYVCVCMCAFTILVNFVTLTRPVHTCPICFAYGKKVISSLLILASVCTSFHLLSCLVLVYS